MTLVHAKLAEADIQEVIRHTGIDLSALPLVMSSDQLAWVLGISVGALAQDRYRRSGIPYVKIGRRVRYLRVDVAQYLVTHRNGSDGAA
ncbi:MAG: helix-turn-helix domain-containing protein [Mycobacterium sp.]|uniref:helix-turn-helix domain-containing protein n=1 Tax=Mycobacterium sp. TaxID=1785 RepID=UPI003F9CDF04